LANLGFFGGILKKMTILGNYKKNYEENDIPLKF
jgi:hypothetical protein